MAKKNDFWPDTSESLILRVKDPHDAAAWSSFLAIYRPIVYRMACNRGLQPADADDLSQQVFVSIASAIERWEGGDDKPPFHSWLHKVARNAIINAITRRKPDQAAGSTTIRELLNAVPDDHGELSSELEKETRSQTMQWAAEQIRSEFSATTWQMFWQTAIEGRSAAHVAKDLERSVGAIYMARYRVMQRLKAKVTEATEIWSEP